MAKFTLTVETDDAGEIATIAAAIAGGPMQSTTGSALQEAADTGEAPRRGRRTKAQIEADNAAAAAVQQDSSTASSVSTAPIETIETEGGTTVEDLMGSTPAAVTLDELKVVMLDLVDKKDAPTAQGVLKKVAGVGRLGEVPKEKYGELMAGFKSAL